MTTASSAVLGSETIRWDLGELFHSPSDPKILEVFDSSRRLADVFQTCFKGRVSQISPSELADAIRQLESLSGALYRVSQYSHLEYAVDTQDETIKKLVFQAEEVGTEVSNQLLFFNMELGKLGSDRLKQLAKDPAIAPYGYFLERIAATARYHLSEKEEQLANLKDLTGVSAHRKLYTDISSAYKFTMTVDGQEKVMNGSELRALRYHQDPQVRREAMKLFFERYGENAVLFSSLYNNVIKDVAQERRLRGYDSAIQMMNTHNDLDDKAVQLLHEVTAASYPLVHRYYHLKRRVLGLSELTLADIYAPVPAMDRTYAWKEAQQIVLEGFSKFDSDFYDKAKLMFDDRRVDAPVLPAKQGGAFCSSSVPELKPYVMLNYLGRQRDISTIAHELGHAIHAMYSSVQPLSYYHSILPLAETASVFSEMLITDLVLGQEKDPMAKQVILMDKLEDVFATSHRQNMFSSFEMDAHAQIASALMSPDEFCTLYTAKLHEMFGDSVVYTPEYRWEWSSIPHMLHVPFYVYSYNFGNLLVMALYQLYLEQGPPFAPKLKTFLSMGSSKSPKAICAAIGVDISDRKFWEKSIVYIEGLLQQLERLI